MKAHWSSSTTLSSLHVCSVAVKVIRVCSLLHQSLEQLDCTDVARSTEYFGGVEEQSRYPSCLSDLPCVAMQESFLKESIASDDPGFERLIQQTCYRIHRLLTN